MLREWDNRNRWRDGQVCPDVGQGIMAPWARRPGCELCHGSLVVMAGMSRVQAKYPPCRDTMHIKSVEFKRPPIGVVVRRGEFQLRCRP
ncbi:hypothetical protein TNCV_2906241 [Trichonephila clavipes]|nr:hypothetical protein TNCV_2906241 [Trichonephila clavipes]